MEIKLDNLIEKLKQDGIAAGQRAADEIVKKAESNATEIVATAQQEAQKIIEDARQAATRLQTNAETAIRQAARDTVLTTKEQLQKLLDRVLKKEIAQTLTPDFLKELILTVIKANAGGELQFSLSEKDAAKLQDFLLKATRDSLREPVAFRVERGLASGFRVSRKGTDVCYDFTDQSIADLLKEFLNPGLRAILDHNG